MPLALAEAAVPELLGLLTHWAITVLPVVIPNLEDLYPPEVAEAVKEIHLALLLQQVEMVAL
jgi:hypothetical protein